MLDGGCFSGPVSAAALGTALSTTLKISSITYELKAVSENARDLLDSTKHVSDNLQTAKTLRRQKSMHFDSSEKKWIDGVLTNTEKTLSNVAALIEPARVDMQTKFGSVGLLNRGLFVFRDSPKVQTHLARLSIASGSLDTVLNVLCTREGRSAFMSPRPETSSRSSFAMLKRKSCASLRSEASAPPAYQDPSQQLEPLDALHHNRATSFPRRDSRVSVITESPSDVSEEPVCSATWGRSPTVLPTSLPYEMEDSSLPPSRSRWHNKAVMTQVQEIPELECHPLESPRSTYFSNRSTSISTTSSSVISSPRELHSHKSMNTLRSSMSPTISNTSEASIATEQSVRPTGRQRGRAWMAHQASK